MLRQVKYYIRCKSGALLKSGLTPAGFRNNGKLSIAVLMYHEVLEDDNAFDAWTVVKESEFCKQMEYLKSHYDVVRMDDIRVLMKSEEQIRGRYALVTFDDGYSGNCRVVLPIMTALNLPFTVFCATKSIEQGELYWWDRVILAAMTCAKRIRLTDMLLGEYDFSPAIHGESRWNEVQRLLTDLKKIKKERREKIVNAIAMQIGEVHRRSPVLPMTLEQLRILADSALVTIGAHSHTHDILTQLTLEEARDNIGTCKNRLETWTGKRIDYFSYPNGDYSPALMNAVEAAGFLGAVSTEERACRRTDDIYAIPRIGIGRYDSMSLFTAKVANAN